MQQEWIQHTDKRTVLIYFNGWGMDGAIPRALCGADKTADSCDILHCWNYRDTKLAEETHQQLAAYEQRILIAWSLGVWAATQAELEDIDIAVAINGTGNPIDSSRGIAPDLFQATLDGYTDAARKRFTRRMCAGSSNLKAFEAMAPQRSSNDQKTELAALQIQIQAPALKTPSWCYDHALIGGRDMIFSPTAQQNSWSGTAQTHIATMPHVPFFTYTDWQEILACLQ